MSVQILRANASITSLQQGRAGPGQFPDPTQINPAMTMQSAQPAHVQPGSENHNSLAQASTQDDTTPPAEPGKVACKLCGIKILKSSMPRHKKTCKKNPDAVKIACERCGRVFSCLSTLNSHLSPPRECTGPTNTTPYSSTRGPGPTRVARTNHRARPYSPSSASSGSEPNRSSEGSPSASSSSSTPSIPSVSSARSRVKSRRAVQQPPPIATGGSLQSFINPDISSDTGSHGLVQQPSPVAAGGGGLQSSVNPSTSSDAGPIQQPPPTAIGGIGGDSQSLAYPPISQFAPPTPWIRRPLQPTTAPYNGTSITNPTQINPSYNQRPAPNTFYTSTTAPPNGFMQRGQVTQPTSHYAHALQYTPNNTSLPLRPPNGLPRYSNVPRLPTPVTVPVPQSNDDYPATAPVHFRAGDPVSRYSSLAGAVSEIPAPPAPQVPGLDLPSMTQSFAQPPQTSAFFGALQNSQTNTNEQRPTHSSSQHYLGPRMQATSVLQAVPQPHANATGAQVTTLAAAQPSSGVERYVNPNQQHGIRPPALLNASQPVPAPELFDPTSLSSTETHTDPGRIGINLNATAGAVREFALVDFERELELRLEELHVLLPEQEKFDQEVDKAIINYRLPSMAQDAGTFGLSAAPEPAALLNNTSGDMHDLFGSSP